MLTIQSRDQIVQVKKIMQEDEERFDHFLGLLEKWIDCHAFIPKNYNKLMLPIFLRHCKYNLDKTKRKLELYFVYKKRYPEVFSFFEFTNKEKKAWDNYYSFEANNLTPEGYRVTFGGFRSSAATGCDMNAVNKILAMHGTYKSNLDVINNGIIIVVDVQHLSPSIAAGILNSFFKRLLEMLQKVYPFRVRGIYVTFLPRFAVPIVNMVKKIFNEKIRTRMFVEAGNEEMKKRIPAYCLPKEFGGTDGTINDNAAKFMQVLMQDKTWFLEHDKIQKIGDIPRDLYDASAIDEHFGTQGSFRKINID